MPFLYYKYKKLMFFYLCILFYTMNYKKIDELSISQKQRTIINIDFKFLVIDFLMLYTSESAYSKKIVVFCGILSMRFIYFQVFFSKICEIQIFIEFLIQFKLDFIIQSTASEKFSTITVGCSVTAMFGKYFPVFT